MILRNFVPFYILYVRIYPFFFIHKPYTRNPDIPAVSIVCWLHQSLRSSRDNNSFVDVSFHLFRVFFLIHHFVIVIFYLSVMINIINYTQVFHLLKLMENPLMHPGDTFKTYISYDVSGENILSGRKIRRDIICYFFWSSTWRWIRKFFFFLDIFIFSEINLLFY